nr:aryl-alcohol dehydrogenase [Quercus suber]
MCNERGDSQDLLRADQDNMLRVDGLGGICKFPAIFGHEGAGYVRAIGRGVSNADINLGDFVLLSYVFCGQCKRCRQNHPAYCLHGGSWNMMATRPADGSTPARLKSDGRSVRSQFFGQSSFAKMSVVQECCVVKFPYEPATAAIFAACGCGFQTGAGTILNVLKPEPDDCVVVFGAGSVGLPALMAAKYLGCRQVVAVDIADERLVLARDLGATDVVNSKTTPDFVTEIMRLTGGADYCLDCAGRMADNQP